MFRAPKRQQQLLQFYNVLLLLDNDNNRGVDDNKDLVPTGSGNKARLNNQDELSSAGEYFTKRATERIDRLVAEIKKILMIITTL